MKLVLALAASALLTLSINAQKTITTSSRRTISVPPAVSSSQSRPSFSAVDMNGQKVDTAALRGKIVVLNLWFINCPNCVEEIGKLNAIVDEYKNNPDVVFIGLAASPKSELQKFLARHPFKYQIVPDAQVLVITKFGTPDKNGNIDVPFPMHYVLDRKGDVIAKTQGIKGVDVVRTVLAAEFAKKGALH